MRIGISINPNIGIGDTIQFSSLPENYFRATGENLIDVSNSWIFDFNPYVRRGVTPDKTIELWNFPKTYEWPEPVAGGTHYQSNAEIWASLLGVPAVLNRPRLYAFEDATFFEERKKILFHYEGVSHGTLPPWVVEHVVEKYNPKILSPSKIDIWKLVKLISTCRMFIGIDSGPAWIAACYPDIVVKKIRNIIVRGAPDYSKWTPLERSNIHSHWDDRIFQVYHPWGADDMGYIQSYRKI